MKAIYFRRFALALCLAAVAAVQGLALDLPVKKVRGEQYYYYKVKKGESIYGISKSLGLSVEEIVRYNPASADGVHKGDLLVFPYAEYAPAIDPVAPEQPEEMVEEVVPAKNPAIAVLLPFGASKSEPSRINSLAVDFYKGMLIAADSLSNRPGRVDIVARDIEGLTDRQLAAMVADDSLVARATVIIAPESDSAIAAIAAAAQPLGTFVLNTLNTRDSLYADNACVLQANVPQRRMYELAVDAMMRTFEGYRPVILRNESGRNEKEAFIAYLSERYNAAGVEPLTIDYKGALQLSELEALPTGEDARYVIVPASGSVAEFNRFAYVVMAWRDKMHDEALASVEVFGYPDWTAFRGDVLDTLHRLSATIYSRFFDDFNGFSATNIASDFRRWYGSSYIESVPTYALLGYDAACYLIKNIRANEGVFNPEAGVPFSGIQSTYDFTKAGSGYVNNALYIIHYQPGGRMSAFVQ